MDPTEQKYREEYDKLNQRIVHAGPDVFSTPTFIADTRRLSELLDVIKLYQNLKNSLKLTAQLCAKPLLRVTLPMLKTLLWK
jgi:hypothetical protein